MLQDCAACRRENLQDAVSKKHVLDGILLLIPKSFCVSYSQISLTEQRSEVLCSAFRASWISLSMNTNKMSHHSTFISCFVTLYMFRARYVPIIRRSVSRLHIQHLVRQL
jgi:hypothetical protein